jgi:hypothetical protein
MDHFFAFCGVQMVGISDQFQRFRFAELFLLGVDFFFCF